jgi:hypothetical protein
MNNQQPLSLFLLWGVMFFWGGGVVESPYITDHNDISVLLEIGHSRNCNTNSSQTKKSRSPPAENLCLQQTNRAETMLEKAGSNDVVQHASDVPL